MGFSRQDCLLHTWGSEDLNSACPYCLAAAKVEIARLKDDNEDLETYYSAANNEAKDYCDEIIELEAQNKKLVEALKLANDILSKNSIYYGDLAEFYKLLIELEIR